MIRVHPFNWSCNNSNLIHGYRDISEESGIVEPVTVQEMKDYMRIEGWSDDDSLSTEFNFDDELISELIHGARQFIEQAASVSLVPHVYEVFLTNYWKIELPFSPIDEIISVFDDDEEILAENIKLIGVDRKRLSEPAGVDLTVTYTTRALNDTRPLTDIKRIVAALYENRGMDINDVVKDLNLLLQNYSRKSAIP